MFETGKRENAAKKAYEIAYAIFRISAKFDDRGIKERIQSYAVDLLVSAKTDEYGNAAKSVAAIDCLIKFAIDLNAVSIANGDVLLQELNNMNEAIAECLDRTDEEVDVSRFFSEKSCVIPTERIDSDDRSAVSPRNAQSVVSVMRPMGVRNEKIGGQNPSIEIKEPTNIIKSGMRQIAILDKIRQSGNCKLKEIQEVLPDCSERTIRYDIEELIERNLIERVGSGGPGVSYRPRQSSVVSEKRSVEAIREGEEAGIQM